MSLFADNRSLEPGTIYPDATGALHVSLGNAHLTAVVPEFLAGTGRVKGYKLATRTVKVAIKLPEQCVIRRPEGFTLNTDVLRMFQHVSLADVRVTPYLVLDGACGHIDLPPDPFAIVRDIAVRALKYREEDPSVADICNASELANAVSARDEARISNEFQPYFRRVQAASQENGGTIG